MSAQKRYANSPPTSWDPRSGHPLNYVDLNPVDYEIRGLLKERVYREPIRNVEELQQRLVNTWADVKLLLTRLSNSSGEGCRPASVLKDDISSILL